MKDKEIQNLSRKYWEALSEMDYAGAEFYDSCLEMMGAKRLEKSEIK